MKINKKFIILSTVTALAVICSTVALGIGFKNKHIKNTPTAKIASNARQDYTSLDLDKCFVLKVNTEFKYIEVQTWSLEYITINFLEGIDQVDFVKGDVINLYSVKKKVINKTNYYFADKDTKIDMYLKDSVNTRVTKSYVKESAEKEKEENNYNYGDAN